jgi:hypothetical protein
MEAAIPVRSRNRQVSDTSTIINKIKLNRRLQYPSDPETGKYQTPEQVEIK